MPKISELAAAASAADGDQLPANQAGTTRRITVAQVRAGLASATHTHTIADVASLQASLDAKQPIDADLTALAANSANGLWARTGNGTGAARSIAAGPGISVANGDGVAGNPTVSLNFTLANIPQSGATPGQVLKWNGTAWAPANDETATGGGGVSSVGLSLPAQFSVTGSPVTSSGTLTAAWTNQAQNTVLAGPATGGAGAPGFRALVAADLPVQAVQTSRQVIAGTGLSGGGDLSADRTLALTGQALALHSLGTNGIVARTGSGTVAARTLTAGQGISITNGDGVAGNPTVSLNLTLADIPQSGASVGQVLKWNGTAWAPATDQTGGGGGGGGAAPAIISASATATYQATGLTGDTVIKLTLGGNTAISAPTFTGLAPSSVYLVRYELSAADTTRTPSFIGFTLAAGVDPVRPMPAGSSLFIETEAHTDGTGAVTLHRLIGVYDPAGEPDATIDPTADYIAFSDASDGGRPKRARFDAVRDMAGRPATVRFDIPNPSARTEVLIDYNIAIGTITSVLAYTDIGNVTVNVQIADHDGTLAPTGAASITGMSAIAASPTRTFVTATGANTMQKTGATDRVLLVTMSGVSGSPTRLVLEFQVTS